MEQNKNKKTQQTTQPTAPFEGPYKTKPSAIAGKKGIGYSTARHLARMGMKKMSGASVKEDYEISESGGPVVWKKGSNHIEKYSENKFALYVNGKKTNYYKSLEDAKSSLKEDSEMNEQIKTTHEDPLVTVHDKDGLHTHANLSTANHIFNTNVKHTDVHKGPVSVKSGREDKRNLKFAISQHHAKAVKDDAQMSEAVTVKKQNLSWGKMVTVHDGANTSYPLHPEHQKQITKLRDGDKTSFKDETGRNVHVHREGDKVHLMSKEGGYKPTTVSYKQHFDENVSSFKSFRSALQEKKLTPAEMKKREEVAKAIERENPKMPMAMKMAIATKTAKRVAEEVDDEGKMAKGQLMRMVNQASALAQMMEDDKQLDGWVQSKLTMASDYLDSVHDYLMHNKQDVDEDEMEEGVHYCAKHVRSALLGDGVVLEAQHADPDENGQIEWYMVEFESGIRKVYTEDLEIMLAEFHGNHKKKKR